MPGTVSLLECTGGCTVVFAGLGVRAVDADEVMRSAHEDTFADDLCVKYEKGRNRMLMYMPCRAASPLESSISARIKGRACRAD